MQLKSGYRQINIGLFFLILCIITYPLYPSFVLGADKAPTPSVAGAPAVGAGTAGGATGSMDTAGTGAAAGDAGKGATKELSPLQIGGIAAATVVIVGLGAAAFSGGGGSGSSSTSNH